MLQVLATFALAGSGCHRGETVRDELPSEALARSEMVREQIAARGVSDAGVLRALGVVPRHEFVPPALREHAYDDRPLPIEEGQTISQPFIVAMMTELAQVKPDDRVLEIGTGSGYQAAVLAEIGARVWSIEILEPLAKSAARRLDALGYRVEVRAGDGWVGWPEHAPFDAILVTAAPEKVPPALLEQLAEGGRLVIPVGRQGSIQKLRRLRRVEGRILDEEIFDVLFVPMTGEAQRR